MIEYFERIRKANNHTDIEVRSDPAKQAMKLYAYGVNFLSELAVPATFLRVYAKVSSGLPVKKWIWTGTQWEFHTRYHHLGHNTQLKEYRQGVWAEFESLDQAKGFGFPRTQVRLNTLSDEEKAALQQSFRERALQRRGRR